MMDSEDELPKPGHSTNGTEGQRPSSSTKPDSPAPDATVQEAQKDDDEDKVSVSGPTENDKEDNDVLGQTHRVSGPADAQVLRLGDDTQAGNAPDQSEDTIGQRPSSGQREDGHEQRPTSADMNATDEATDDWFGGPGSRAESRHDVASVTGPDAGDRDDFFGQSPDRDDWGQNSDQAQDSQQALLISDDKQEDDGNVAGSGGHRVHIPETTQQESLASPPPPPPPQEQAPEPVQPEPSTSQQFTAQGEQREQPAKPETQNNQEPTTSSNKASEFREPETQPSTSGQVSNQASSFDQPKPVQQTQESVQKNKPATGLQQSGTATNTGFAQQSESKPAPPVMPGQQQDSFNQKAARQAQETSTKVENQLDVPLSGDTTVNGKAETKPGGKPPRQKSHITKSHPDKKKFKFVLVGDGGVGKTAMLKVYITDKFPQKYVPTDEFGDYKMQIEVDGEMSTLELWDTAGRAEYDMLRPLTYAEADMVMICFSVVDPKSIQNVKDRWHPEAKEHAANAPVLLVGTKIDMRKDPKVVNKLAQMGREPVELEQGLFMASEIKAVDYVECSSLTQEGLENVFDAATTAALDPPKPKTKFCTIL